MFFLPGKQLLNFLYHCIEKKKDNSHENEGSFRLLEALLSTKNATYLDNNIIYEKVHNTAFLSDFCTCLRILMPRETVFPILGFRSFAERTCSSRLNYSFLNHFRSVSRIEKFANII